MKKAKVPRKKVAPEQKFRQQLIARAIYFGCEKEVSAALKKYDILLKGCTNVNERDMIVQAGIKEIYSICPALFSSAEGQLQDVVIYGRA